MAFTNASDDTSTSDVVTYTVGPPYNAKNLAVNQMRYPQEPVVVTWSAPTSPHEITFYVIELSQLTHDGVDRWRTINYTSIQGMLGYSYRILLMVILGHFQIRSSLIHFACIGVAPLLMFTRREQPGGATLMQAKWIKLDLLPNATTQQ